MFHLRWLKLFISSIVCFVFITQSVSAQFPDVDGYSVRKFTDENGLPQNSVNAIVPDVHGFIWLATEGGLVRFDGKDFFTYDRKATNIKSSRIQHIIYGAGKNDLLAVNDNNEGIRIHNGHAIYPVGDIPFSARTILQKYFIPSTIAHINFGQPKVHKSPLDDVRQILIIDNESYYVCTKTKVEKYVNGEKKYSIPYIKQESWAYFLLDGEIYCHIEGNKFTTFANGKATNIQIDEIPPFNELTDGRPTIYWQTVGHSAYFYWNNVLYKLITLADGKISAKIILSTLDFEYYNISSIHYDEEMGYLFLGSATEGLFFLTKQHFDVLKKEKGKLNNVFYAHTYFGDNTVLTGQGIIMGPDVNPTPFKSPILPRLDRYSILIAKHGNESIWTKDQQTLYEYSRSGKILNKWQLPGHIHLMYENDYGILWLGLRGTGLYKMDLNQESPVPVYVNKVWPCTYFQQADDETLWIGTMKGLRKLSVKTNKLESVPELENVHIKTLYIKDPEYVWGTASEEGLFLIRNGKFTKFPMDHDNYLSQSHCILEDHHHNFWISSNKGLFQVSEQDLLDYADGKSDHIYYFYYGKESGFETNEFNGGCQPCGVEWPDGRLSFPSLSGLVLFDPNKIKPEFPNKEIFFDQIILDEKSIRINDTIDIPYNFHRLTFNVTTPYWGNYNNLYLEASLEKNKKTYWTRLGRDNSISFTTLPRGTYKLTIRKSKGFGFKGYIYKSITIQVSSAYWETWWFTLLVLSVLGFSLYMVVRYRVRYIIRRNNELEKIILQRTQDLRETVFALKKSEDLLKRKSSLQQKMILAFSHDLKSPLLYLKITGQRLYENVFQLPDKMAESIRVMYNSSFSMYHFTDNFLNYAKTFFMNESPAKQQLNLHDLVTEKIDIFKFIAQSKNIIIENSIQKELSIYINKIFMSIIIHNLLDNAIKYTDEGYIKFSAIARPEYIQLLIADTGMGMTDEVKEEYADFFKKPLSGDQSLEKENQRLGLRIVKEVVTISGGTIEIESEEGIGTVVKVIFWADSQARLDA